MSVIRLQFEIDEDQLKALDRLRELGGLRTRKDLMNNAITLLKWAVRERLRGSSIVSVNEGAQMYKELEMPFLENVTAAADARGQSAVEEVVHEDTSSLDRNKASAGSSSR